MNMVRGAAQYAATSGDGYYSGTEKPLAASADTAVQVWGGSWRMPSRAQCVELTANTTFEWVTDFNGSGVNGAKYTAKNGNNNYVFFPAAGRYYSGSISGLGNACSIWCSSDNSSSNLNAYHMESSSNNWRQISNGDRTMGISVRGVLDV